MKWIKKNNKPYGWVATFPCDTPFFSTKIIDEFIKFSKTNDSLLYFIKSNKIAAYLIKELRKSNFYLSSVIVIHQLKKS